MCKNFIYAIAILICSLPASAQQNDVNNIVLVGNVTGVTKYNYTNPLHITMGVVVNAGAPTVTSPPVYLYQQFDCKPEFGCWDTWWFTSNGCQVKALDFGPSSFASYACQHNTARDSTSVGACVKVTAHLWASPQTGDNIVIADQLQSLPWWMCDSVPYTPF